MHTSPPPEEQCFKPTLDSFCQSLVNAIRVARMDEDGEPAKITQHALADQSGVARSTIAKYVSYNARSSGEINPDLETICRLAQALNVPPALLLMRDGDWRRLAQAAGMLAQALADPKVIELSQELREQPHASPVAHARTGLQIGERLGICPPATYDKPASDIEAQQVRMQLEVRRGAMVTSALPPGDLLKSMYCAPLLSLCASLGATTKIT